MWILIRVLKELFPMFRTETVAFLVSEKEDEDGEVLYVADFIGRVEDLTEDEQSEYTHTAEVSSLCWLWCGMFPTIKSDLVARSYE